MLRLCCNMTVKLLMASPLDDPGEEPWEACECAFCWMEHSATSHCRPTRAAVLSHRLLTPWVLHFGKIDTMTSP